MHLVSQQCWSPTTDGANRVSMHDRALTAQDEKGYGLVMAWRLLLSFVLGPVTWCVGLASSNVREG